MIVVAISGASGPIMGIRLIEELLNLGDEVAGIVSDAGWTVISHELSHTPTTDCPLKDLIQRRGITDNIKHFREFNQMDFFSPLASGSAGFEAIVVIPSSMKTLSAIANGYANTLITRICDVALKEHRKCIIVPRETPLNLIHIENMRKVVMAGASILPPTPGFYTRPKTIDDVVNFVVGKVLNIIGREHTFFRSWGGNLP